MTVSNKKYSFTLTDCYGEQWGFESDHLWGVGSYLPASHHDAIQEAYSQAYAKSVKTGKTEMYSLTAIHNATGRVVHDATQHVKA
jgi:hypothetical protein